MNLRLALIPTTENQDPTVLDKDNNLVNLLRYHTCAVSIHNTAIRILFFLVT